MEASQDTLLIICCVVFIFVSSALNLSASLLCVSLCAALAMLLHPSKREVFGNTFGFSAVSAKKTDNEKWTDGDMVENPRRKEEEKEKEEKEEEEEEEEKEVPHRGLGKHTQQEVVEWTNFNVTRPQRMSSESVQRMRKADASFMLLSNTSSGWRNVKSEYVHGVTLPYNAR